MKIHFSFVQYILITSLLFLMLYVGIYYLIPYDAINPLEYFTQQELKHFHIYNIFVSGVAIPFVATSIGYIMQYTQKIRLLIRPLTIILIVCVLIALLFNGSDPLYLIIISSCIALMFLKMNHIVKLLSAFILYFIYLTIEVLPRVMSQLNGGADILYTAVQRVNDYTFVYRSTDIFRMVAYNYESMTEGSINQAFYIIFLILPLILIGQSLYQLKYLKVGNQYPILSMLICGLLFTAGFTIKLLNVITLGSFSFQLFSSAVAGPLIALGLFFLIGIIATYLPLNKGLTYQVMSMYFIYSLLMVMIFYGIGLKRYGTLSISTLMFIVVIIYVSLIVIFTILERKGINVFERIITKHL